MQKLRFSIFLTFSLVLGLHAKQDLLIQKELADNFSEIMVIAADCSDAVVKLIKDKNNKNFVLKQIADPGFDEQFLLVRDLVASEIGVICGIPVNKVFIVSTEILSASGIEFYPDRAATIHEYISGKSLEDSLPHFLPETFSVQQRFCNPDSPWQKKRPLKNNEQGLTKDIIINMSFHNDLPRIVAFDTFVGNADRSLPNIFYDESEDKFFGIDHAAAFNNKNLSLLAIERLKELQDEGFFEDCDEQVLNGLKLYHETLKALYEQVRPELVEELLEDYSKYVCKNNCDYLRNRVMWHCCAFKKNYEYTKELIDRLERLICNYEWFLKRYETK